MRVSIILGNLILFIAASTFCLAQEKTAVTQASLTEWKDEFTGKSLDENNWEQYSIEGTGNVKVENDKVKIQGSDGSRAGIRTTTMFKAERFLVSAKLNKVENGIGMDWGNAVLSIFFDNTGVFRIEWLLKSDGRFEAWIIREGKSERIDNRKLGTKEKIITLGIARKGDEFFFMLNGEVGMQKKIPSVPKNFKVMLYGFGTSKSEWDMASVITPAQ